VVSVDGNCMRACDDKVSPFSDCMHDSEHLSIVSWVFAFRGGEHFGSEGNREPGAFLMLFQESPRHDERCIREDAKGIRRRGELKDWL
jgi:hypothetical protein